jgi:hypothetical protein
MEWDATVLSQDGYANSSVYVTIYVARNYLASR